MVSQIRYLWGLPFVNVLLQLLPNDGFFDRKCELVDFIFIKIVLHLHVLCKFVIFTIFFQNFPGKYN